MLLSQKIASGTNFLNQVECYCLFFHFYDTMSRTYRRITVQDLANATRIADALDNVEFYMCMGSPMDVPHEIVDRHMWATAFEKHK